MAGVLSFTFIGKVVAQNSHRIEWGAWMKHFSATIYIRIGCYGPEWPMFRLKSPCQ